MTDATATQNYVHPDTVEQLEELTGRPITRQPSGWYLGHCPCAENHNTGDSDPSLLLWEKDNGGVGAKCLSQACDWADINGRLEQDYGVTLRSPGYRNSRWQQATDAKEVGSAGDGMSPPSGEDGGRVPADEYIEDEAKAEQLKEQYLGITVLSKTASHNADHIYRDAFGRMTGGVWRDIDNRGQKRCRPYSFVNGIPEFRPWANKQRIAYRLDELVNNPAPVLIVEGEKAADAAAELLGHRFTVISWPGGKTGIKQLDWSVLDSRVGEDIYFAPDNDDAGEGSMVDVFDYLVARGHAPRRLWVIRPPEGVPQTWDVADEPEWTTDDAEAWADSNL